LGRSRWSRLSLTWVQYIMAQMGCSNSVLIGVRHHGLLGLFELILDVRKFYHVNVRSITKIISNIGLSDSAHILADGLTSSGQTLPRMLFFQSCNRPKSIIQSNVGLSSEISDPWLSFWCICPNSLLCFVYRVSLQARERMTHFINSHATPHENETMTFIVVTGTYFDPSPLFIILLLLLSSPACW
jgi:hypothetical protein